MSAQLQTSPPQGPALVVFGRDEAGKPHASSFTESDVGLATKAAGLMGMSLLPVRTEAERALAARVPKGRVFASGKGFVPFVKATLFAQLEAAAPPTDPTSQRAGTPPEGGSGEPDPAKSGPSAPAMPPTGGGQPTKQPGTWAEIEVGSIVLAAAAPRHMDWYEFLVVGVEGDDFTLRYCDYPKEPYLVRRREEIGLMHPSRQPEPPVDLDAAA